MKDLIKGLFIQIKNKNFKMIKLYCYHLFHHIFNLDYKKDF